LAAPVLPPYENPPAKGKEGGRGGGRGGGGGIVPGNQPPDRTRGGADGHRREPPPTSGQGNATRNVDPPANGLGKPPGFAPGDWTIAEWKNLLVDYMEMDKLAATSAGAATCKARPHSADLTNARTHAGTPKSLGGTPAVWAIDECKYCAFRARAPAGTPDHALWWYGNGCGDHNPYRCGSIKRYLCEGGDKTNATDREFAVDLRACLRKAPERPDRPGKGK